MFWKILLLNIVCYSNFYITTPYQIGYSKNSYMKKTYIRSVAYDDNNERTGNLFEPKNSMSNSTEKTPVLKYKTKSPFFSKKEGRDERYDTIDENPNNLDVIMNLTKFYDDMALLRQLESNISHFAKINLINENDILKDKNNSIYAHNILAGGLLRDW